MKRAILAAFIIIGVLGCAATWPEVCPVVDEARKCRCAVVAFKISDHPTKQSPPAGRISVTCDGQPLPVSVTAEQVEK